MRVWSYGRLLWIQKVVYYESLKRELKTKPTNECRCDERLQTRVEESTILKLPVSLANHYKRSKDLGDRSTQPVVKCLSVHFTERGLTIKKCVSKWVQNYFSKRMRMCVRTMRFWILSLTTSNTSTLTLLVWKFECHRLWWWLLRCMGPPDLFFYFSKHAVCTCRENFVFAKCTLASQDTLRR